jgi:hypothetical protein
MMVRLMMRSSCALLVFCVCALVAGCSGSSDNLPREAVAGTVTLDGQPLPAGTISFAPMAGSSDAEGTTGGGDTIKNGKFAIARDVGLLPGNYNVAIFAAEKDAAATKPAQVGAGRKSGLAKELIPAKYNSKTELKAEVKKGGGNEQMTFPLQSK